MLQRAEYFQNLKKKFKGHKGKYQIKLSCGHFLTGDWSVTSLPVYDSDGHEKFFCWHCEAALKKDWADRKIREWEEQKRERERERKQEREQQAGPGAEFPDCD